MALNQYPNWSLAGVYEAGGNLERIWHSGLSSDGRLCFISGEDDFPFIVWNIDSQQVIWKAGEFRNKHPELEDFLVDGYFVIDDPVATGKYRVFGLNENYALVRSPTLGIELKIDQEHDELILLKLGTLDEIQRLKFRSFSGDWFFASFSEDSSTIAVIEPYFITFFRQEH